ncbi:hypothetical protein [Falsiroseomonas sp.]|uniref:hypothetical protein n=1 Tax=Falsiroseomonas sp. TaxID=2870721 RepID=UPI0034A45B79
MWGLLIILAGSPMPQPVTWHTTHDACHQQAAVELLHAATTRREVLHVECRSYVLPRTRPITSAAVRR